MSINFSKLLVEEIAKNKKKKNENTTTTSSSQTDDYNEKADELMSDELFYTRFFTRKPIADWDKYRVY